MEQKTPSPLGVRLAQAIAASGLSASAFAEKAGVSRSLPGQLTRGDVQDAKIDVLKKYAAAAGVSLGWLLTGEEAQPSEPRRTVERDDAPRSQLAVESPEFRTFARGQLRKVDNDGGDRAEMEDALDHAALVLRRDRTEGGAAPVYRMRELQHALAVGLAFARGEPEPPPLDPPGVDVAPTTKVKETMDQKNARLDREAKARRRR